MCDTLVAMHNRLVLNISNKTENTFLCSGMVPHQGLGRAEVKKRHTQTQNKTNKINKRKNKTKQSKAKNKLKKNKKKHTFGFKLFF